VIVIVANEAAQGGSSGKQSSSLSATHGIDDLIRLALKPMIDAFSSAITDVVRQQLLSMRQTGELAPQTSSTKLSDSEAKTLQIKESHQVSSGGEFSRRELEVLRCLVDGCSNKAIARRMDIAETTVKIYVRRILSKTQSSNRTQAVLWAIDRLEKAKGAESPNPGVVVGA
jgi:two-component system nitrate/nitrite response regulator NarL